MIRQFTYKDEVKALLEKIMDKDIDDANVIKNGTKLDIKVNFSNIDEAMKANDRLRQSGVKYIFDTNKIMEIKFSFDDNNETVDYLHKKMKDGIVKSIVENINIGSAGLGENAKKVLAEQVLKEAANKLGIELGKSTERGGRG